MYVLRVGLKYWKKYDKSTLLFRFAKRKEKVKVEGKLRF
jgi:hypothetical protein